MANFHCSWLGALLVDGIAQEVVPFCCAAFKTGYCFVLTRSSCPRQPTCHLEIKRGREGKGKGESAREKERDFKNKRGKTTKKKKRFKTFACSSTFVASWL